MTIEKGTVFAETYLIVSIAGAGGTATVYEAYDQDSKAPVAVKVYDKELHSPGISMEIWDREVSALNKINHASIVQLINSGKDPKTNLRFIVTEWLPGRSLEEELNAIGPISWDEFFRSYGDQILSGLCYAFEKNIIHRDISLKNILSIAVPLYSSRIIFLESSVDPSSTTIISKA